MKRILLSAAVALCAPICAAQTIKVWVDDTAKDTVGQRLVYAFKEQIRRSAALAITENEEDDAGRLGVHIVTMDPDDNKNGNWTIYSFTVTMRTFHKYPTEAYLVQSVGKCGSSRIEECASGLVATTDRQASYVRKLLNTK